MNIISNKIFIISLIFLIASLFGCASNQQTDSKNRTYSVDYSFDTKIDYLTVYQRIYSQSERCIMSFGMSKRRTSGETDEDSKSARIEVASLGIMGISTHMTIDITTVKKTTRVSVKNSYERWDVYALAIKEWAHNIFKQCK